MGRPRMGKDVAETVAVRLPKDVIAAVDRWAADNNSLTKSDAVRALLVEHLRAKGYMK